MACSQCFHNSVCGSSSPYSDSSQCKTFVDKDSLVPIDVLHKVREELAEAKHDRHVAKCRMVDIEKELHHLRIIKQTLEMCSGRKFDF